MNKKNIKYFQHRFIPVDWLRKEKSLISNVCSGNTYMRVHLEHPRGDVHSNFFWQPFHIIIRVTEYCCKIYNYRVKAWIAPDQYSKSGAFTFVKTTTASATAKTQKQIYQWVDSWDRHRSIISLRGKFHTLHSPHCTLLDVYLLSKRPLVSLILSLHTIKFNFHKLFS